MLREDAEDERREEALDLLPLALFAPVLLDFVPDRGLLFEADERPLCLDELLFACAIYPSLGFRQVGLKKVYPEWIAQNAFGDR